MRGCCRAGGADGAQPLQAYTAAVDFDLFRLDLEAAMAYWDGARGARPPYGPVLKHTEPTAEFAVGFAVFPAES